MGKKFSPKAWFKKEFANIFNRPKQSELFVQFTLETTNPEGPVARLTLSEEYLLLKLTNVVEIKSDWMIEASVEYMVCICHGKLKSDAVRNARDGLLSKGFIDKVRHSHSRGGNEYLVSPVMMRKQRAETLQNYRRASELELNPESPVMTEAERVALLRKQAAEFVREQEERRGMMH